MVKSNIDKKFSAHYDAVEAELKSSTVGKSIVKTSVSDSEPAKRRVSLVRARRIDGGRCFPSRSGDAERYEGQAGGSGEGEGEAAG